MTQYLSTYFILTKLFINNCTILYNSGTFPESLSSLAQKIKEEIDFK